MPDAALLPLRRARARGAGVVVASIEGAAVMVRRVDFEPGDELVMLLPIERSGGERIELERWPFDRVVDLLEQIAEGAARGEKLANGIYQRLVFSLRRFQRERESGQEPRMLRFSSQTGAPAPLQPLTRQRSGTGVDLPPEGPSEQHECASTQRSSGNPAATPRRADGGTWPKAALVLSLPPRPRLVMAIDTRRISPAMRQAIEALVLDWEAAEHG